MVTIHAQWRVLAQYGYFILHHNKIPTDPVSGKAIDPHNVANAVDLDTLVDMINVYGPEYGVGYVIREDQPIHFLDVDHCVVNGQWSPIAQELMTSFNGSYREVSMSGEGLHFLFVGNVPPHSKKNALLGIELYTGGRYVALTGLQAVGNVLQDCTGSAVDIVTRYFPPAAGDGSGDEWRTEPVPEWKGPADDQELIQRMMKSGGAKAIFGGGVTFKDLWNADPVKLGAKYTSFKPQDPFDRSSADAALAQHLAFWTGKNHDRMKRLMQMSALKREKWEGHEKYLGMTISNAVGKQKEVYIDPKQPVQLVSCTPTEIMPVEATLTSGHQFMGVDQQLKYFAGCVYIRDQHRVLVPDGDMLKPDQFNAMFGGYEFTKNSDNTKTTIKAWEAFIDNQAIRFPKVATSCFRPELPASSIVNKDGRFSVNTYVPIQTEAIEGDVEPFLNHMRLLFPEERDRTIMISYMAAIVQHPEANFQWCPVIQGAQGNGKTFILTALAHCIGQKYCHFPNASDLIGNGAKFNLWMWRKILIGIEEIHTNGRWELPEMLKPLITNKVIEFQGKGKDQFIGENYAKFIMMTNHKDALPVDRNDRRFAILYTAQQSAEDVLRDMGGDYFPNLYDHYADIGGYSYINYYLQHYQIPDEFNPAGSCHRAPKTSSSEEAITMSLGRVEQEVMEAVEQGRQGFRGGWVSSLALGKLLKEINAEKSIPQNKRKSMLEKLGYIPHPALKNGRTNRMIPAEGGKPRLFILKDHPDVHIPYSHETIVAYNKAQGHVEIGHTGVPVLPNGVSTIQ